MCFERVEIVVLPYINTDIKERLFAEVFVMILNSFFCFVLVCCLFTLVLKFVLRFCLLSVKVYCANRHLYFFRVCVLLFVYFEFKYFLDFFLIVCVHFPLSYECMCV